MKIRPLTMTAACVLMGGLALAGCSSSGGTGNGSSGGNAGGATATTQAGGAANAGATTAANAGSTAQAGSTGGTDSGGTGAGNGTGNGGANSSSVSSGSNGYATCQTKNLKISLSGQNTVSSQVIQWVQLSNAGSSPCTMDGFAGVDLVGSANGQANYSWSLERDSETYSKITLKAGEAAYFGIKYLPWSSADSAPIKVDKIELTPPNTTTTVTLSFSASIVLQDGATHPGTYLTPIALGTGS